MRGSSRGGLRTEAVILNESLTGKDSLTVDFDDELIDARFQGLAVGVVYPLPGVTIVLIELPLAAVKWFSVVVPFASESVPDPHAIIRPISVQVSYAGGETRSGIGRFLKIVVEAAAEGHRPTGKVVDLDEAEIVTVDDLFSSDSDHQLIGPRAEGCVLIVEDRRPEEAGRPVKAVLSAGQGFSV